jgi:D-3-phosphoglycerate dehydrogenase
VAQALAMEMHPYCDRVIGYDNHPRSVYENFHRRNPLDRSVIEYSQLSDVLEYSDVISIHTAGDDRVFKGNELYFASQRPFIINTSRNGHVDEANLLSALRDKRIRGAAFTVPADQIKKGDMEPWVQPFLELKNVLIAPAIGNPSLETKKKGTRRLAQAVIDFVKNKDMSLAVNPMDVGPWRQKERYPLSKGAWHGAIPMILGQ